MNSATQPQASLPRDRKDADRETGKEGSKIEGDTPAQRLLALLEVIAAKDQFFTLQGLVEVFLHHWA